MVPLVGVHVPVKPLLPFIVVDIIGILVQTCPTTTVLETSEIDFPAAISSALAVMALPAANVPPAIPVKLQAFEVTVVVPMDTPPLYTVMVVPLGSELVPETEVLVVRSELDIYGVVVFNAVKVVPEVKEVNDVAGKEAITAFNIAGTLLLYLRSSTPPTSEIVPTIPLPALVIVTAAKRTGLPLIAESGTKKS